MVPGPLSVRKSAAHFNLGKDLLMNEILGISNYSNIPENPLLSDSDATNKDTFNISSL